MPTACPVPLREGNAPQGSAPCLSTLSLLISWPTYLEALFSFCAEHPLTHSDCLWFPTSSPYVLGILTSLGTEANILIRKGHWLNHLRINKVDWGLLRVLLRQKQPCVASDPAEIGRHWNQEDSPSRSYLVAKHFPSHSSLQYVSWHT